MHPIKSLVRWPAPLTKAIVLMTSFTFSLLQCCERFNINWEEVKTCAHGDQGSILLNNFGQLTHSLSPPIGFIPTITINKVGFIPGCNWVVTMLCVFNCLKS